MEKIRLRELQDLKGMLDSNMHLTEAQEQRFCDLAFDYHLEEDIEEKRVEFIYDSETLINNIPKLDFSYVYFAEKGRVCRFFGNPELQAWIPLEWEIEAKEE